MDFYRFSVTSDSVQGTVADPHMATVIDLDYADGIGRPDYSLSVFDSTGKLILTGLDSNIAEDQPGANQGVDMDDLTRGSAGVLDPYLGTVQLPAGSYSLAVSTASVIPSEMQQFQDANPPNPQVRVEPINSVERIAEDRIGSVGGSQVVGAATLPQLMNDPATSGVDSIVPYTLSDIVLFVSQETGYDTNTRSTLDTVNPFTGAKESRNGSFALQHGDIAMRPDGQLFTFSTGPVSGGYNSGNLGDFLFIDTGTGQTTSLGNDNLSAFWITGGNVAATGNAGYQFEAMMFTGNKDTNLFAIGNRIGESTEWAAPPRMCSTCSTPKTARWTGTATIAPTMHAVQGAGTAQREIGPVTVGGVPLTTTVTGMARIEGTTYIVDNTGILYSLSLGNAVATQIIDLNTVFPAADLPDALAALTKVPGSVENGLYANVLIAIEQDGTMFAFFGRDTNNWNGNAAADFTAGSPAPIFVDGNSVVDTGITNVTGLAFSTLQSNLWHTTSDRWSDIGHGVAGVSNGTSWDVPVFDNSRYEQYGNTSLYFGIEDPNDNWANNLLYRDRTVTDVTRAPGGARDVDQPAVQPEGLRARRPARAVLQLLPGHGARELGTVRHRHDAG